MKSAIYCRTLTLVPIVVLLAGMVALMDHLQNTAVIGEAEDVMSEINAGGKRRQTLMEKHDGGIFR